jgi:hypothetical protein
MLKPYKIPTTLLLVTVALLALGEIVTGTKPLFVFFMAGTLICIGITYNVLGGVSTIGGIAFAGFASTTIVISQFAKVIFMEAADKTLESPELTIKVYFVFYFCALIGCFVYKSLRVKLPKPLEPRTFAQADLQYGISVSVGLVASLVYEIYESSPNPDQRASTAHSIGLAFSVLLLFSLVLAVQSHIRATQGRHSFSLKAFIPWMATVFFGFIETSRSHMMLSTVIYISRHLRFIPAAPSGNWSFATGFQKASASSRHYRIGRLCRNPAAPESGPDREKSITSVPAHLS